MGLDVVEILMRTEEVFDIEISNQEAETCITVGDLYSTILRSLSLPECGEPSRSGINRLPNQFPALNAWRQADVWTTLHALIVDQLQVSEDEVVPSASFTRDLGAD